MEYDHLDYSRPIQKPNPHYHRTTSSATPSSNRFPSFSESSYDAPIPHPKQININVPPLPMKNQPSPSSSTASTVTQDDNIDAIISIDKPMQKSFLQSEAPPFVQSDAAGFPKSEAPSFPQSEAPGFTHSEASGFSSSKSPVSSNDLNIKPKDDSTDGTSRF